MIDTLLLAPRIQQSAPKETSGAATRTSPIKWVPSLSSVEVPVEDAVTLMGSLTKIMEPGLRNETATLGMWKRAINH